jgi:hypothetical protein
MDSMRGPRPTLILFVAPVVAAGYGLFGNAPARAQQTVGLFLNDPRSFSGYTLFAPQQSSTTYLIDNHGKPVHAWGSSFAPGLSAYLLEDGHLLRTARYGPGGASKFNVGGAGGLIEERAWDGTLVWAYVYSSILHRQHHDIERLPNGNVLLIAWEGKSGAEAIAAGRSPAFLTDGELWPDHVIEVKPSGETGGLIVWEWDVWDHLIQEYDPTKDNYGVVADHPELIDVNYKATTGPGSGGADWTHINAIDYNESLDQILVSVHGLSEIWVIDHSTTTEEAAGHTGGNSGKGGDLLYRWGNPQAYDRGDEGDRKLFGQHDSRWIEAAEPGGGNILVFNNGRNRPGGNRSTVDEIVPLVDVDGDYELDPDAAYGPDEALWSYPEDPADAFYAQNISGAHRLPNGNTLVCDGPSGTYFEVTPAQLTVWKYVNPITGSVPIVQGQIVTGNATFRVHRYAPDYPAFDGRDLTPGDPLETHTSPFPVPDGEATTIPMTGSRVTGAGDWIEVEWDASSCQAYDYHLIFGTLAGVSTYALNGWECRIGVTGTYDWQNVPPGDLFFLLLGVDDTGVYESRWGADSSGAERNGPAPSNLCNITTKDEALTCP